MSEPRITYMLRADVRPEKEAAALAGVYKFLLDRRLGKDASDCCAESQPREEDSDESLKK